MLDHIPRAPEITGRVARYVDPVSRTWEDATFVPAGEGELFCVFHHPLEAPRGNVIICPSIFTEELKIYGAQVMAAHALLRQGKKKHAAATLSAAFAHARAHDLHRTLLDALPDLSPLLDFASEQGIGPEVTGRLMARLCGAGKGLRVTVKGLSEPLRPRELQMLRLIGDGLKNKEIAARLDIEPSTVKVHLRSLYAKLGATSRSHALARARELGMPLALRAG